MLAGLLAVQAGCASTDEGLPCVLLGGQDGGGAAVLLESEVPKGKDVVSYGSPDCEERLCVRDARYLPEPGAPEAVAMGYCSRPCAPSTGCHSRNGANPLTCRQLIYGGDFLCAAPAQ
ncbi:MAG: adventurous gliding motility lipoprotein CglC [Myxococcaceae bacterium]